MPIRSTMNRWRRRGESKGLLVRIGAAAGLATLVVGLGWQAHSDGQRSIDEVEVRFEERIELAARYVETHLADMRERQLNYARLQLSGDTVTAAEFDAAVLSFGFEAAVLLDGDGRVLAVSPQSADLVGTEIASRYRHLSEAVAGWGAVSGVVPSAVEQRPIVAVAVPFDTPTGRRVISGGYELATTPLAVFLTATTSLDGRELYLVDDAHQIVASTESTATPSLADHAPALAGAPIGAGTVEYRDEQHLVVTKPVDGTGWRIVAAVPAGELYAPVTGASDATWPLVAASGAMALAVLALLQRVYRQRDDVEALSRTDVLTGLPNRNHADEALARAAAASARSGRPWAVAMIDIDRFKAINDRLGHPAGDAALRHVASVLARETRSTDVVARWGGEEFVLVMQDGDDAAALAAGERMAAAVRTTPSPDGLHLTVSVGTAAGTGVDVATLLRRADAALYEAKESGRDRVVMSAPDDAAELAATDIAHADSA